MIVNTEDMKIPLIVDEHFSKFLQKFMHSFRNKDHPTININNLLILNGPEKQGKSWFLRHNLKLFAEKEADKKPLVIHYDIREIHMQNFSSFLFNFEQRIIEGILERNIYEHKANKKVLIDLHILKKLLFFRWEKSWIEINLANSLKRCIDPTKSPYTFSIENEFYDEMVDLINKYEKKAYKETVLIDNFERVVELIERSMKINTLHAGIILIQDLLIHREIFDSKNNKNNSLSDDYSRDGLHVMEYLFDVMNYMAGYHEWQLKEDELRSINDKMKIYPHILLALESVQDLFEMKDAENKPVNYLHRIMLRLYVKYFIFIIRTILDIEITFP